RVRRLGLGLAVLGAVALRLLPLRAVFPAGAPLRLVSADCEYHLARVERALRGEPIPVFDPDLDFPEGGIAIWPPLFDHAAAALVRAARLVDGGMLPAGRVAA